MNNTEESNRPVLKACSPAKDPDLLYRENEELIALVQRLIQDGENVLSSRTWKIGYTVSSIFRKIFRLLRISAHDQHIRPGHFENLAGEYAPFIRYRIDKVVLDGTLDNIPKTYLPMNVETALQEIWTSFNQRDKNDP